MQFALNGLLLLRRLGAQLGPYLMIEILLPGGTLLALLLYAFRRYRGDAWPVQLAPRFTPRANRRPPGEGPPGACRPMSKAPRTAWIGLAVLALPCMPYSMDPSVLDLAVSALGAG